MSGFPHLNLWNVIIKTFVPPYTCSHSFSSFFLSVSRPDKVFFPPANWKVPKNYGVEQDVGPAVEHIYEVISCALSCADSMGLSRLGWKAHPTVHRESPIPRAAKTEKLRKMYSRAHGVI